MDTKKIKEKAINLKTKVKKFYEEHGEAVNVMIGGCIGAFIFGYYAGGKIQDSYEEGYDLGYQKGQDSVMDEMWSCAVRRGGSYSERFTNKNDGRRLRMNVELLPEKHIY